MIGTGTGGRAPKPEEGLPVPVGLVDMDSSRNG
jgi:hypothetical protein